MFEKDEHAASRERSPQIPLLYKLCQFSVHVLSSLGNIFVQHYL